MGVGWQPGTARVLLQHAGWLVGVEQEDVHGACLQVASALDADATGGVEAPSVCV